MSLNKKPEYLFGKAALSEMRNFIDNTTLFAFDLDGTLAPIAPKPCVIGIPNSIRKEFTILKKQATVAVITGRSRRDALHHLGISPRFLVGNHGAEGLPGWKNRENEFARIVEQWQSQLNDLRPIASLDNTVIENKGLTLSIHYRHAANIKKTHADVLKVIEKLVPQPLRIGGKFIENLIPPHAPDKGISLKILMKKSGREKGLFVGDDETDENVFRLEEINLFTVRVGRKTSSKARFYLRGQHEVLRLLREINRVLKKRNVQNNLTNNLI